MKNPRTITETGREANTMPCTRDKDQWEGLDADGYYCVLA